MLRFSIDPVLQGLREELIARDQDERRRLQLRGDELQALAEMLADDPGLDPADLHLVVHREVDPRVGGAEPIMSYSPVPVLAP